MECGVLGAVCALVIGIYAAAAHSGGLESLSLNAADTYYNLLVQGFRAGQLNLKKEVPAGLAQLADPYDPTANAPYLTTPHRMFDLSYYKGRVYLYFGVTPALILFWPFAALTGHYLFHRQAVAIFCALGFLASVGLLCGLWQRYFAGVNVGVVAACVLALGLATGVPVMLPRSDVYEVAISCGYLLTMLALGALWCALHEPEPRKRSGWLAAASAAYGLAVGARPSLLFGAIILLVPVAQTWRERKPVGAVLTAAITPILAVGLGLMFYNAVRFDNPFEFGGRYQLAPERLDTGQHFGLQHLWFNFRVYFLEPARWSGRFPFVRGIVVPPLPPGHHGDVEMPFGVLTNIPLVWLALTVPLVWRDRSPRLSESGSILQGFLAAVSLLFGICALTMGLFFAASMRYEVDFLPALVLLAVVGILGLERVLAPKAFGAGPPLWRQAVRWGWGLLLGFSVAFNVFAGVVNYSYAQCYIGNGLLEADKIQEAIRHYELALRIQPDFADAHHNLGYALEREGRLEDALGHYEQAVRIVPGHAYAHNDLGAALQRAGKVNDAIAHYEQALEIKPDYAKAHYNLGVALVQAGRPQEAIGHYEQALRLKPDYAQAHNDLGTALWHMGRAQEAIRHFEQTLQINPDLVEAHYNLGATLESLGRVPEAIQHYEQVLRIKPDDLEAQRQLARLRAIQ